MSLLAGVILRVIGVVALCLVAAIAWVMVDANREIRADLVASAERVSKEAYSLAWRETMFRGNAGQQGQFAFPDWRNSDTLRVIGPGYCVSLAWTGEAPLRLCGGPTNIPSAAPAWFAALDRGVFGEIEPTSRDVVMSGVQIGTVVATADGPAAAQHAWRHVSVVAGVAGAMAAAIMLFSALAIGHALLPAKIIAKGLRRLQGGDTGVRLPAFGAIEFNLVARAFNDLTAKLAVTTEQRAAITRRLFQVQEDERRALARDLHDEFGQCLTATRALAAAVVTATSKERPDVADSARDIGAISDRMATNLRSALARLRPPDVDDLGIAGSLAALVANWNTRMAAGAKDGSGAIAALRLSGDLSVVPPAPALAIYRIVQEGLTNAAKHGSPSEVVVEVRADKLGEVSLTVEDDGGGKSAVFSGGDGHGLLGVRERVDALGGKVVAAPTGRGFRIAATLPIEAEAPRLLAAE